MKRPNILFLMSDQMGAKALAMYAGRGALTPHLDALAARGTVFENAYCSFPLCAPSRFAMMTGRLPSRIGAYDNGAEFPSSTPTFVHYLRRLGYATTVSGKLHYIGADQLHGFEERLTTDIYPADFGWTGEWEPLLRNDEDEESGSGVSGVETVADAGPVVRSMQIDYDEQVFARGVQKIYDIARGTDQRPFFLMVSFTQPHDPYVTRREFWDLYADADIPEPDVAPFPLAAYDRHSRELYHHYGIDRCAITPEMTRAARRGYFGMISDIDAKIGALLTALDETGLADNTVVVYTSDHGDMMGERGLWFKKTLFEWAVRVPLILALPGRLDGGRVERCVSHLDLLPTLVDLAAGETSAIIRPIDGASLLDHPDTERHVLCEHLDEGTTAPRFMIRKGEFKYVCSPAYEPQLYDLGNDPNELTNLADAADMQGVRADFEAIAEQHWDADALREQVIDSQHRRRLVHAALSKGRWQAWDYVVPAGAGERYVRHHDRFPEVERRGYLPYRAGDAG